MATLLEQSKRLKSLNPKEIVNQVFKALKEAQGEIIKRNKRQLVKGEDVFGNIVGRYSKHTQGYANADGIPTPKKFNEPYNFIWFGNFFDRFEFSINKDFATISSSGVGSGDKKDFLTTHNLFGLNDENLKQVIKEDILPFIQRYARKTLRI